MSSLMVQYYSIKVIYIYRSQNLQVTKIQLERLKVKSSLLYKCLVRRKVRMVKLKYSCQIIGPVALVSTEEDVVRSYNSLSRQGFY